MLIPSLLAPTAQALGLPGCRFTEVTGHPLQAHWQAQGKARRPGAARRPVCFSAGQGNSRFSVAGWEVQATATQRTQIQETRSSILF